MRRDTSAVFSGYRDSCFDSNFFNEHPRLFLLEVECRESKHSREMFFLVGKRLGFNLLPMRSKTNTVEIYLVKLKHIDSN